MRKIIVSVICCITLSVSLLFAQTAENQLRLGTFNIEKLGKANEYQSKNAAEILKDYDIVAIQEVMNTGATKNNPIGNEGIEALKRIVSYLGEDWDCVISSQPKGTASAKKSKKYNTFEYYAFIFRKSKIELIPNSAHLWDEKNNPISGLKDQDRQFDREPFIASFKSKNGNLDFTLITIHAASPVARWRRDEIKRLAIVYKTVQDSDAGQNDVFLMGDFNTNVDKKEWDTLKSLPGMAHIITAKDVTTLNKSAGKLSKSQYDTVWYEANYSTEDIVPDSAQVDQAWKNNIQVPQNVKVPWSLRKKEDRKKLWLYGKYVSDHLPVTMLLWMDKDTDHFGN